MGAGGRRGPFDKLHEEARSCSAAGVKPFTLANTHAGRWPRSRFDRGSKPDKNESGQASHGVIPYPDSEYFKLNRGMCSLSFDLDIRSKIIHHSRRRLFPSAARALRHVAVKEASRRLNKDA